MSPLCQWTHFSCLWGNKEACVVPSIALVMKDNEPKVCWLMKHALVHFHEPTHFDALSCYPYSYKTYYDWDMVMWYSTGVQYCTKLWNTPIIACLNDYIYIAVNRIRGKIWCHCVILQFNLSPMLPCHLCSVFNIILLEYEITVIIASHEKTFQM